MVEKNLKFGTCYRI